MKILVTGGAGYIGSHFSHLARSTGLDVVIFDDFSSGHRFAVDGFEVVEGDVCSESELAKCFEQGFDAVCHFAGKISVAESVEKPSEYHKVNVDGTANILRLVSEFDVNKLLFSSTAAVYGAVDGDCETLVESSPLRPMSPYGQTKLQAEQLIQEWVEQNPSNGATVFRYFNASGAGTEFGLGEAHYPETHLIPNAIYTGLGRSLNPLRMFGTDYDTSDGTCLRDYVHVLDIAEAHLLALDELNTDLRLFNLGSNSGYTVAEVVGECERQLGIVIPKEFSSRREGDLPALVASNQLARDELGWNPKHSNLSEIIASAIVWHRDIQPAIFS